MTAAPSLEWMFNRLKTTFLVYFPDKFIPSVVFNKNSIASAPNKDRKLT